MFNNVFLLMDCSFKYLQHVLKTYILLSDNITNLWGERRPVGTSSPGPGFDSRHGQQFNQQGEKFLPYLKTEVLF